MLCGRKRDEDRPGKVDSLLVPLTETSVRMEYTWPLGLFGFLWLLALLPFSDAQTVCSSGWFGSTCQYQCHCTVGSCNSQTGECNAGSRCVPGWFGPACQYEDLVSTQSNASTLRPLFNGDYTCNNRQSSNTVTVALKYPFPFTWLRLISISPTTLQNIEVKFSGGTSCTNMKSAKVNSNTRDIHCQLNNKVSDVILEGVGVKDLCSVAISGGRNVALKQATEQSSIYGDDTARSLSSNAVGGNTNNDWSYGSCTHTSRNENPHWSVRFPEPQMLNRYVVYNREDHNADRLRGFELTSYAEIGAQVFHYKDESGVVQSIYSITPAINTSPISRVTVRGFQSEKILTICEFEAYGDPICPVNQYGRECEHTCNCAVSGEQCFVSTGGCPSGCAAGYYGEDCNTQCPAGKFGYDCNQTCSQIRARGVCDSQSGHCTDCTAGWYGQFCNLRCDQNCGGDNSCDRHSGDCIHGCDGNYSPPTCIDCVVGLYADSCDQNCSKNCKDDGACVKENGTCTYGCKDDYVGPMCKTRADQATGDQSTDAGLVIGLGVGIGLACALLIAGAIGLSIYCYRRRQEAKHQRRRTPPGYDDMNPPGQDEHSYHVIYKTDDNYDLPHGDTSDPEMLNKQEGAKYVNADVGHYEMIMDDGLRKERDGQTGQEQQDSSRKGHDNAVYVNC